MQPAEQQRAKQVCNKWREVVWPATTDTHHPYHTSQVLWPYRTCWSIHGPLPSAQIQCGPLTMGLEPQIRPTSSNLAPRSWIWLNIWFGNCLSSSTKSTGMEVAHGNSNVHWTSHMMMMILYNVEWPGWLWPYGRVYKGRPFNVIDPLHKTVRRTKQL